MKSWELILIILVCVGLIVAIGFAAKNDDNHSAYYEKGDGVCPVCGAELVKGVYGAYTPNFVWYCPECP